METNNGFLEIFAALRGTSVESEKIKLSGIVENLLSDDDNNIKRFLQSILTSMLRRAMDDVAPSVLKDGFCEMFISPYDDVDSKKRVAISISYIQSYEAPVDDLDDIILHSVHNLLKEDNLDFVVNDISVNSLQMRNGSITVSRG